MLPKAGGLCLDDAMKSLYCAFLAGVLAAWGLSPAAFAAGAGKTGTGASFKGPAGLQLYSLRDEFKKDVPGTMARVKDYGVHYVELAGTCGLPNDKFLQLLKDNGLKGVSGHLGYDKFRDDPEGAAREAKALGLQYVGCAWISHNGAFDEKQCRAAAAVFNRAGEACAKQGIRFFYHNHGYEFEKYGDGTLFDLLMAETNPKFVYFQMDVFWTVFPAQDPVKLLEKYGNRWQLMHLKDMRKGLALGSLSGGTDVKNDVTLGTGQIDLPAVLRAAKKAGVKYYFIEDESPDAATNIPNSLKFLESVKF